VDEDKHFEGFVILLDASPIRCGRLARKVCWGPDMTKKKRERRIIMIYINVKITQGVLLRSMQEIIFLSMTAITRRAKEMALEKALVAHCPRVRSKKGL
jgi:hypothetical protein